MKNIYNFVNEPLKNKFNPSFNYYIYENILELNFQKLKQDILSLEKNMVKKYPAFSDGDTASIRVIGGIDIDQSSLTPNALAYVQVDGSISSNTTDTIAGQALSPTTLLIKNQWDMLFD